MSIVTGSSILEKRGEKIERKRGKRSVFRIPMSERIVGIFVLLDNKDFCEEYEVEYKEVKVFLSCCGKKFHSKNIIFFAFVFLFLFLKYIWLALSVSCK